LWITRPKVGEIVLVGTMNNPGTVIMTVSDLSEIEVEAEVDETDIANVRIGQSADIKVDAFQDTVFAGIVTEVGNSAKVSGFSSQDQITNFLVKVQFVTTFANVKPGMTAEVDVTTARHRDVLHVPIQAVVIRDQLPKDEEEPEEPEGGGSVAIAAEGEPNTEAEAESWDEDAEYEGVYVIRDGKAVFIQVETGIADQQNMEITSGLEEGEEIVIGPYKELRRLKHKDLVKATKKQDEENSDK